MSERNPLPLDAAARDELRAKATQATRWCCEKCDGSAVVRYPEGASVYDVAEQIRASHARVSPNCGTDLAEIRVVEVPDAR